MLLIFPVVKTMPLVLSLMYKHLYLLYCDLLRTIVYSIQFPIYLYLEQSYLDGCTNIGFGVDLALLT